MPHGRRDGRTGSPSDLRGLRSRPWVDRPSKLPRWKLFSGLLPVPSDVVIMGHILHNWNLEEKWMLLTKVYDALPLGGAVIGFGALIDDERTSNAVGVLGMDARGGVSGNEG